MIATIPGENHSKFTALNLKLRHRSSIESFCSGSPTLIFCRFPVIILLFIALLFCHLSCGNEEQDVIGCGGAVISPVSLDYTSIEVILFNEELKEIQRTECAPHNGYFFLPMEQKGYFTFEISAPPGWNFEPQQISINFNGESDDCSQGKDINFEFVGFDISGQVVVAGADTGPLGVNIALFKHAEDDTSDPIGKPLKTNLTNSNVLPGTYVVRATHSQWSFSKEADHITVSQHRIEPPRLILSGYDVSVQVHDFKENGIQGAYLAIASEIPRASCNNLEQQIAQILSKTTMNATVWCTQTTDATGAALFNGINPGRHYVSAFVKDPVGAEYIVSPLQQQPLKQKTKLCPNFLSVQQISPIRHAYLSVTVTTKSGDPISNVLVSISTKQDGIVGSISTGKDGKVSFSNLDTSRTYSASFSKQGLVFEKREVILSRFFNSIRSTPSKFEICGQLNTANPTVGEVGNVQGVQVFVDVDAATSRKLRSVEHMFYSGVHPVNSKPKTFPHTKGNTLHWEPDAVTLNIPNDIEKKPVHFTQVLGAIEGSIACMSSCTDDISLLLSTKTSKKQKFPVLIKNGKASFRVEGLLPEIYIASISKTSWCFNPKNISVAVEPNQMVVGDRPVQSLDFTQTGYSLKILASHTVNVSISHNAHKASEVVQVLKGRSRFQQDNFEYNTEVASPIELNAQGITFYGKVSLPKMCSTMQVTAGDTNENKWHGTARFLTQAGGMFNYSLQVTVPLNVDSHLTISGCELYFSPSNQLLRIPDQGCPEPLQSIVGKEGIYINGATLPPLSEVMITLSVVCDGIVVDVQTTHTDNEGKYVAGPISQECTPRLEATKQGYVLTPQTDEPLNFIVTTLGSLELNVTSKRGEPLQGAVLTVTGGTYRKTKTTSSTGVLKLENLTPQQYFIKPLLKGHIFQPASLLVNVTAGQHVLVHLTAIKSTFSICGRLQTSSGHINNSIDVGATIQSVLLFICHNNCSVRGVETHVTYSLRSLSEPSNARLAKSNGTGHFCIEDINANTTYKIKPILTDFLSLSCYPEERSVLVQENDVTNQVFHILRKRAVCTVSGRVKGISLNQLHLSQVQLFAGETLVATENLFPHNYFEFQLNNNYQGDMTVRVIGPFGKSTEAPVDSCSSENFLEVEFPTSPSQISYSGEAETHLNLVAALIVITVISFIVYLKPLL
eukprot:gene2034-5107_t